MERNCLEGPKYKLRKVLHSHAQKYKNAQNVQHMHTNTQSLWILSKRSLLLLSSSAAGNLFYLNGASLCLSPAHLLTWYSAVAPKQNYHCMGWGNKWRSFPQMIMHSHVVLQFSDYGERETHTHKYAKSHRLKEGSKLYWSYIKVIPLTMSCGTT